MTLSIIDSMLRGDLRRHILPTLKTEKEISLLWRDLKNATQGNKSLMAIEQALIAAVETSGFVQVSADYNGDREVRLGAEEARKQGLSYRKDDYTSVGERISLDGLFNPTQEITPTDKFLHLLVKVECMRTLESLLMLAFSVRDDAVVRTFIRKLFSSITTLCKEANDLYIKESLTQLYFEIYHTFRSVLEKGEIQAYETDFENFVYDWKGEFPDDETVSTYNRKAQEVIHCENKTTTPEKNKMSEQSSSINDAPKDKFDRFLEEANKYTFSEMPIVKELGTPQKIRRLVESMLQEKESVSDTFGHTAAMLEFLGFYKWIADKHVSGYRLNQYDSWCTKNIMNKVDGNAFRHYRLSVKVNSSDKNNASYKYLGWKYYDSVKEEYNNILKG